MKSKSDYKYPTWVWIIFVLIMLLSFIGSSYSFATLIWVVIFFLLKPSFTSWAIEKKKNPVFPFLLVAVLGLIGFGIYYLYYLGCKKSKKKKLNSKKKIKKSANVWKIIGIIFLSILGLIILVWFFWDSGNIDEELLKRIEENVVLVKYEYAEKMSDGTYFEGEASGSGVFISEDGENYYLFTNRHVVDCGYWNLEEMCWERLWEKIQVRTRDGKFHEVTEIAYAPHEIDIVQLTIKKEIGDFYRVLEYTSEPYENEFVIAVGYPTFSSKTVEFSVSGGYITGFRELLMDDGFAFEVIDSDAYTNFGSSGGGLFNEEGDLLGINTWIDEDYYEGYAISYYFLNNIEENFFFCEEDAYVEGDDCVGKCAEDEISSIKDGLCYEEANKECEDGDYFCEDPSDYCFKGQCIFCPDGSYLFEDGECYYKGTKERPYG